MVRNEKHYPILTDSQNVIVNIVHGFFCMNPVIRWDNVDSKFESQ